MIKLILITFLLFGCAAKEVKKVVKSPCETSFSKTHAGITKDLGLTWVLFDSKHNFLLKEILKTDLKHDFIGFYSAEGVDTVLIVMVLNDCVVRFRRMETEAVRIYLTAVPI